METVLHAPIWVWGVLAVLLVRGIKGLRAQTMSLLRLFLLPVIFLVWGGYALCVETQLSVTALLGGVVGLPIGGLIGWQCWRRSAGLQTASEPGYVIRPGSPWPLCFIVVAFVSRFAMTAYLHLNPAAVHQFALMAGMGLWSGCADGVFWGGTCNLVWRYRQALSLQTRASCSRR